MLDPEDWWIVPNDSALAKKIAKCYPEFSPVTNDEGELVDVVDHRLERLLERRRQIKEERDEQKASLRADAAARGYCSSYTKTRVKTMSMGFLQGALRDRMQGSNL